MKTIIINACFTLVLVIIFNFIFRPIDIFEINKVALFEFKEYLKQHSISEDKFVGPQLFINNQNSIELKWKTRNSTMQDSAAISIHVFNKPFKEPTVESMTSSEEFWKTLLNK
jgi:hypothetical protein